MKAVSHAIFNQTRWTNHLNNSHALQLNVMRWQILWFMHRLTLCVYMYIITVCS